MNEFRITIEEISELAEAVKMLAGVIGRPESSEGIPGTAVSGGTAVPVSIPTMPVNPVVPPATYPQMPAPAPMPQGCGQAPVSQPVPAGSVVQTAPGMAGPVSGVPITAVAQNYTLEQLQVAAAGLSSMGKMPQVMGILQQFGIQAMTELPAERYGEFAAALREAGAQI